MCRWLIAVSSFAASTASAGSLDDYLLKVAQESPALTAIKADIEVELSRAGFAALAWRPSADVTWTVRRFQDSSLPSPRLDGQARPGATLSWRLWDWGATSARVAAENHDIRGAIARHRRRFVDALAEAGRLYVDSWAAGERMKVAASGEKCAAEAVQAAQERRRGSVSPESAVRAAQTEAEMIRSDRLDARADQIRALALLTRFARVEKLARPSLELREPTTPAPEVEEAVMAVLKAEQDHEAAVRQRYPVVEGVGTWDHTAGTTYSDAMIGARVRVDLFDQGGSDVRRGKAHADRLAARAKVDAAERQIEARKAAATTVITSAEAARAQARRVADLERARLADAKAAVATGKGDSLSIAQACRRIATAERQAIDATARRLQAQIEVRAAVGDLP